MSYEIPLEKDKIGGESTLIRELFNEIGKVIVGQRYLIERLFIGLLTGGHVLLEGVPGLAKTLSVKTLASAISCDFQRIQFTPDLLPADLIGTLIYNPATGSFSTKKGPVFSNIILADEINRAPAKVQSALLEAMAEREVTIGEETYQLDEVFLVLATQNPIEQEGTYPLPEAQLDRFMLKLRITYPTKAEERQILERMGRLNPDGEVKPVMKKEDILRLRNSVDAIYMDEKIKDYILDIVFATREPAAYGLDLKDFIEYGASPRATICLTRAAKAYALIKGRDYVVPQDIKSIGPDVLRHRIIVSYEAEAEDLTSDDIIMRIFEGVRVP